LNELKKSLSFFMILTLLVSFVITLVPTKAKGAPAGFVTQVGRNFKLNGSNFYYAGNNTYYLGLDSDQTKINALLQGNKDKGIKVLRIWAFNNRPTDGIQTSLGVYNETNFRVLDYAVWKAGTYGIKLIMTLVNNWNDYNGMQWYVDSRLGAGQPQYKFYSDSLVKQDFKNYISTVLNRTNFYSGVVYKNDPNVFAWELTNEGRNQSLPTNDNGAMFLNWVNEMGAYIKGIDPNHMLATGEEGFKYGGTQGGEPDLGQDMVDYNINITSPYINFGTIHIYPPNWGNRDDAWVDYYIKDRAAIAHNAGKPMILEEYGVESTDTAFGGRDARFARWHTSALEADVDGTHVWQMENFDNASFSFNFTNSAAALIANLANAQNIKSGATPAPTPSPTPTPTPAPAGVIDLSNTSTSGSQFGRNDTDQHKRAQTFTATNLPKILSVDLRLRKIGTPTNMTVELFATSANKPTGSALKTVTVAASSISTLFGTINVPFAYTGLVNGTKYAIVLGQGTVSNTDYYEWTVAATSSTEYFSMYTGTTWLDNSSSGDGSTKIYLGATGTPTPTPTPTPAPGIIDVSNTSSSGSSFGRNDTDQHKRFQTFVATGQPKITSVDLRIKADNGVPSNLTVELFATSGGMPTGSALATAQLAGSAVSGTFGTVSVPITYTGLVNGTKYAIVLGQVTISNTTFYEWAVSPVSSTLEFGMYSGTTWLDNSSVGDGSTKIHVSN
jgi:hypothetical protein